MTYSQPAATTAACGQAHLSFSHRPLVAWGFALTRWFTVEMKTAGGLWLPFLLLMGQSPCSQPACPQPPGRAPSGPRRGMAAGSPPGKEQPGFWSGTREGRVPAAPCPTPFLSACALTHTIRLQMRQGSCPPLSPGWPASQESWVLPRDTRSITGHHGWALSSADPLPTSLSFKQHPGGSDGKPGCEAP